MNARDDDHWKHGTTFHFMAEEVDAGDVVARRFAEINEEDTSRKLYEKVCAESVQLFQEMLPKIATGEVHELRKPQTEFDGKRYFYTKASLDGEKKIPLDDLRSGDVEVYDKIRALDFPPFEPAYATIGGQKIYLTHTSYETFELLSLSSLDQ